MRRMQTWGNCPSCGKTVRGYKSYGDDVVRNAKRERVATLQVINLKGKVAMSHVGECWEEQH